MKWITWSAHIPRWRIISSKVCNWDEWFSNVVKGQHGVDDIKRAIPSRMFQQCDGGAPPFRSCKNQAFFSNSVSEFQLNSIHSSCQRAESLNSTGIRWFQHYAPEEPILTRDRLARLWHKERKLKKYRHAGKRRVQPGQTQDIWFDKMSSSRPLFKRLITGRTFPEETFGDGGRIIHEQPPLSEFVMHLLKPTSPEEAQIARLLARSNLLVTRDIEWANLVLGFEQENRYAIVDPSYPQSPVGFIREQSNVISRQLLRTRRPFIAYIIDAMGNELFRVRRPIWFINSTIYTEVNGKEIGVVHRRWHLWKRVYDLYLGNKQFAVVENPGFWNWTFTLKDIDGNVLAEIDRDWRGIGFELFTDAGQYVIRFGNLETSLESHSTGKIQELNISRPLSLSERAVALALAISLDNDYFSRHGGWGIPFIVVGE